MKKTMILMVACVAIILSSCTNYNKSMREPYARVDLKKTDFTFSDQVSGEATSTKILGIDWQRLFLKKQADVSNPSGGINLASIPVIGGILFDKTSSYALYDMMEKNPGYDIVFYPQFESKVKRPIGLGFIYKVTTVKATARLAKMNK